MNQRDNFLFFFTKDDYLSNFYYKPFRHKNQLFKWSEQAVMWEKAKLFGATDIATRILRATSANECKKLGRSRQIPFDEFIWETNRERIYKEVLLSKFSEPQLKQQLLATNDLHLVEASPYDAIWGIKMAWDHPDATDPSKWRGLNLLGKTLMQVRAILQG